MERETRLASNVRPIEIKRVFLAEAEKTQLWICILGVSRAKERGNSEQRHWILPKANGRAIIKLTVSFSQDQQGMPPPKRHPILPAHQSTHNRRVSATAGNSSSW